jgi:hypothetical protein
LAEKLPAGPQWKCKPLNPQAPTKRPVQLFYRDAIECLQALLQNPLVADHVEFTPLRVFKTAEKLVRKYSRWMTADVAWNMQVRLLHSQVLLD